MSNLIERSSVVVTGGAGFIGSTLVDGLLAAGAKRVVVLDSLRTSTWTSIPEDRRIEKITADVAALDGASMVQLLSGADFVFHLAAEKHNQSITTPERLLEVNVSATYRLFRAAAEARVRKVVFTSSLYAAGRMSLPPMIESERPEPRTVYGASKVAGEHLLAHFAAAARLRSTALRLFFVYGPRQFVGGGYKSVIVTNFERILRGEAPVILGDGGQALDYVFVDDVVRALIAAAVTEAADGEIINVGSGQATTISALTDTMLRVAGSSLKPVFGPADWTAGTIRVGDRSKAAALLGWTPFVELESGLSSVYRWLGEQT